MSACFMHSAAHAVHIAMHACIIAIMLVGSYPVGRSIARIIVLHMSAQSMHMLAHLAMSVIGISPIDIELSAQTVHACSQAEHASIRSCIAAVSMPGMLIAASIILEVILIIAVDPFWTRGASIRQQLTTAPTCYAMLRARCRWRIPILCRQRAQDSRPT
jgi:hypothetical protein